MRSYGGKIASVTGAAGGIGRCLVDTLLEKGAVVWASDHHEKSLEEMKVRAEKQGFPLHTRKVDVTSRRDLESLRESMLSAHGRIDLWVNNAGVAGLGGFVKKTVADFDKVIDVNLRGVILGTRVALEPMEEAGSGIIVNMASVAGHIAPPYMTAYATTKHAVVGFTRALREELKLDASSVRMILVSPGFVDTAILAKGSNLGFPAWLSWMLSDPTEVCREMLRDIMKGRNEIYPTLSGKLMLGAHKLLPALTVRGSKILLTRSFKDFLLNRYVQG